MKTRKPKKPAEEVAELDRQFEGRARLQELLTKALVLADVEETLARPKESLQHGGDVRFVDEALGDCLADQSVAAIDEDFEFRQRQQFHPGFAHAMNLGVGRFPCAHAASDEPPERTKHRQRPRPLAHTGHNGSACRRHGISTHRDLLCLPQAEGGQAGEPNLRTAYFSSGGVGCAIFGQLRSKPPPVHFTSFSESWHFWQ